MTNGNDCAYPTDSNYQGCVLSEGGLTKREIFAAMAMQGFISSSRYLHDDANCAADSIRFADALIEQLKKTSL
jgi:hypothetical protein